MNEKPELRSIVIINLVNNIPIAIVMSTAAPLLSGMAIAFSSWAANVIIAFILGLVLTYYNVRMAPAFIFAFFETFVPLYLICFVVSMVTNPIAMNLALGNRKGRY